MRSLFESLNLDPAEQRRIQIAANRAWMSEPKNRLAHNLGLFGGIVCGIALTVLLGPLPIGGAPGAALAVMLVLVGWAVSVAIMIALTMRSRCAAVLAELRRAGHPV